MRAVQKEHGREMLRADHIHRSSAIGHTAIAELAEDVFTPALDRAGIEQRTGVIGAGRNSGNAGGKPGDVHRSIAIVRTAVAELTLPVTTPAPDRAGIEQRAGVTSPGRDSGNAGGKSEDVHRSIAIVRTAIADLAVFAVAPALDRAGIEQRAGVIGAKRKGGNAGGKPGDVHRSIATGPTTIAELAFGV